MTLFNEEIDTFFRGHGRPHSQRLLVSEDAYVPKKKREKYNSY